ncbi:MAG: hypothetical protein ABH891_02150 [Candidatus Omnitrophota bacterium]
MEKAQSVVRRHYLSIGRKTEIVSDEIEAVVAGIQSKALRGAAKAFSVNLEDVLSLEMLPLHFSTLASYEIQHFAIQTLAEVRSFPRRNKDSEEQNNSFLKEEIEKIQKQKGFTKEDVIDAAFRSLDQKIKKDQKLKTAIRALYLSGVMNSWVAFESLVKDAWILMVNANPTLLVEKVLGATDKDEDEDKITKKGFSVGLLSKYDFNIKKYLGALLSEKFDFTSLKGMRKAYKAIRIGSKSDEDFLNTAFQDGTVLKRMESIRHLIAHRGGIIDSEYKDKNKTRLKVGTKLTISHIQTTRYFNEVARAGCSLIKYVDQWLLEMSKKRGKSSKKKLLVDGEKI